MQLSLRNFVSPYVLKLTLGLSLQTVCLTTDFGRSAAADTVASVAAAAQAAVDTGETPRWWTPSPPAEIRRDIRNKAHRLADGLKLADDSATGESRNALDRALQPSLGLAPTRRRRTE